jgi:ribonuclease Z
MECFLLGTGGMMPMPSRLLTSLAVRLNGQIYLFDAGEGTQLGLKKTHLGIRGLDVLAVSHLHADHCLGVPGILMLRAQIDHPEPLTILGPPGIHKFVCQNHEILDFHLNYPVHFIEWAHERPEIAYEDKQVRILWRPLQHTRFCLGYRLEELERPGKFYPEQAEALGIPRGPLWRSLQLGETIILETGEIIAPHQVMGSSRRGRHVAFVVDTRPTESIHQLCQDVDIAFMEGMFLPKHAEHAHAKGHLSVVEAASIAMQARVGRAVLVHISPRYDNFELDLLEAAAKAQFDRIEVGRDFEVYEVGFKDY